MASLQEILVQGLAASSSSVGASLLSAGASPAAVPASVLVPNGTDAFGIMSWIRGQPGGYFHPHQELRLQDPTDPSSAWMLYATEDIPQRQVLSKIPWDLLLIGPEPPASMEEMTGALHCGTVRRLAREMSSSSSSLSDTNSSTLTPFLHYLRTVPAMQHQIPAAWSTEGKEILVELLGDPALPPGDPVQRIDDEWYARCDGDDDGVYAATLLLQRGLLGTYMVPTYDWYTHRNGDFSNCHIHVEWGKSIEMVAQRPIGAGEPLYVSYDRCEELCNEDAVEAGYGTPGT